jgi:hypothetical protein
VGTSTIVVFVADDIDSSPSVVNFQSHSVCATGARCISTFTLSVPGIEPYVGAQGTRLAYVNKTTDSDGDVCITASLSTTNGQACTTGGGRRYPAVRA